MVHALELVFVPQGRNGVEGIGLGVGVSGHEWDVLLANALEVAGYAKCLVHALDPGNEGFGRQYVWLGLGADARGACELG